VHAVVKIPRLDLPRLKQAAVQPMEPSVNHPRGKSQQRYRPSAVLAPAEWRDCGVDGICRMHMHAAPGPQASHLAWPAEVKHHRLLHDGRLLWPFVPYRTGPLPYRFPPASKQVAAEAFY
jgi:hypothetical protein